MIQSFTTSDKTSVWVIYREEISTIQEGDCNVYAILDGESSYCFGAECSLDEPSISKISDIFINAYQLKGEWPQKILILKSDPFIASFEHICSQHSLPLVSCTPAEISPYTHTFAQGFKKFTQNKFYEHEPLSAQEEQEIKDFIPDTYSPCPCASGKKYKFCCKKILTEITLAMCAAQDGDHQMAIQHMNEAEAIVGQTAEVCCRYAVVWSFTDNEQYQKYIHRTLAINPKHPRAHYLRGIDAVKNADYAKAIEYYNHALTYYPESDRFHINETLNNLGTAYYLTENYQAAKETWEKAVLTLPTDSMSIQNLFERIYNNVDVPEYLREPSPFVLKRLAGSL